MDVRPPCPGHGRKTTVALAAGAAAMAGGAVWTGVVRPWHRNWGATAEEIFRAMPFDDRVVSPTAVTTRAVTVRARPEHIWPWIAQMGESPRGGYYSYVWIERLQGMRVENSGRVLPEWQSLRVGDRLDRDGNMVVLGVDPGSYVVLGPSQPAAWLDCTWVIALYPVDRMTTRLVTRVRARVSFLRMLMAVPPLAWPLWLIIDPGVFVMERKMLLEIKKRAERLAREGGVSAGA